MNLDKLFETQKKLDDRIVEEKGLQGVDLLDKKTLALQVELGELANEWQMFKFWKDNPEPNTSFPNMKTCENCKGSGYEVNEEVFGGEECNSCGGRGAYAVGRKNPLLEEYVDCLHFILSIGNDLGIDYNQRFSSHPYICKDDINKTISWLMADIPFIGMEDEEREYLIYFAHFIHLGEMLGFTWEQIEQAYYDKNKINHERQANGY